MSVTIRLFGTLIERAGRKTMNVGLRDQQSLRDLLAGLVDIIGPVIDSSTGLPTGQLMVSINGKLAGERDFSAHLKPGDIIGIYPPVDGG